MTIFSRPAREKPGSGGFPAESSKSHPERFWQKTLRPVLATEAVAVDAHIREGRFQRCMALMAGASSILAGLEVSYEHYHGSFGQKVMWSPVLLSGAMTVSGKRFILIIKTTLNTKHNGRR
jgi:hypothetical protein